MFSFLGELFGALAAFLWGIPQRIVENFDSAWKSLVVFVNVGFDARRDSPEQTIASMRSSVGPPQDWLSLLRSLLWPIPMVRVRVPARRSIQ